MPISADYKRVYVDRVNHFALLREEIALCLGIPTEGKVGRLCGNADGRINRWARYKPVRLQDLKILADADYIRAEFGFDVSRVYEVGTSASVLSILMTKAEADGWNWTYLPPRGLAQNEPFRPLDFDGYNAAARVPYRPVSSGATLELGGPLMVSVIKEQSSDAEIDIKEMNVFLSPDTEHAISDYRLGAITRRGNIYRLYLSTQTLDQLFIGTAEADVTIDLADVEGSATDVLFCFTTISPGDVVNGEIVAEPSGEGYEDASTIWLPTCHSRYIVSAILNAITGMGGYTEQGADNYFFVLHNTTDGIPQTLSTRALLTNGTGEEKEADLYLDVRYLEDGAQIVPDETYSNTGMTIGDAESYLAQIATFNIPSPLSVEEGYDASNIFVRLRWEWPEGTNTKRRYFNFGTGITVARDPGFVSLSSIMGTFARQYNDL